MLRLVRVAVALVAGLFYVWYAAVRNVSRVKRRKARRRAAARG